jgi:thiamine transporter
MPEVFLGLPMTSPWLYSLLYNGIYMGLNTLVCLLAFALLRKPLGRYVRGEDLP